MKKLLVLLFVVAIGAGGYYLYKRFAAPEARACGRLAELCGEARVQRQQCEEGLVEFKRMVGEEAHGRAMGCIADAKSCLGAAGCVAGGGLSGAGEFLKGLVKSVKPDLERTKQQIMEQLQQAVDQKLKGRPQEESP
jgi:hypothetical protein